MAGGSAARLPVFRNLVGRRAWQTPRRARRSPLEQERARWYRQLPEDSGEGRQSHAAEGAALQPRDRRLMDPNQPAQLALRPAIRKPELPNGATNGRSANRLRIRWLTPGFSAHHGQHGVRDLSTAYPGFHGDPTYSYSVDGHRSKRVSSGPGNCAYERRRPPTRGGLRRVCDEAVDQIGPRPTRALPRMAFHTTTTITAPMAATTIVVRLMPVV